MLISGKGQMIEGQKRVVLVFLALCFIVGLGIVIAFPHQAAADSASLTISYVQNATDQGGQPLAMTAVTNGFTASTITWYQNGSVAGSGSIFVLQPNKVGRYNITVVASTSTGGSFIATAFFFVNQPLSIASFDVPQSTSNGRVTATVSVFGGTPPFHYLWSLNQKTQLGCGSSTQCTFNLTEQGMNNISVTVFDSANFQVQTQVAHVLYQQASNASSNSTLLYAGAGGGVVIAAVMVYLFMARRKTGIEEKSTAVSAEAPIKEPAIQQKRYYDENYNIGAAGKTAEIPSPVVKIVEEQPKQQNYQKEFPASVQPRQSYTIQTPKQATEVVDKQNMVSKTLEPVVKSVPQTPRTADLVNDPAEWIVQCVLGKGFWPAERGALPKSELEKEFKKKFPDITLANFNTILFDLVYKDKIDSEIVNGQVVLKPKLRS